MPECAIIFYRRFIAYLCWQRVLEHIVIVFFDHQTSERTINTLLSCGVVSCLLHVDYSQSKAQRMQLKRTSINIMEEYKHHKIYTMHNIFQRVNIYMHPGWQLFEAVRGVYVSFFGLFSDIVYIYICL